MFDLFLIPLFIFSLVLRLLATVGVPQAFDSFGHLYFAKELKSQKAGPFGSIATKVVGGEAFSLPYMWHWLIGFLPLSLVGKYQRYFNPLIDAGFTIYIYLLAMEFGFEHRDALFCCGIYLLTPAWFSRVSLGPRVQSFTPRLAGEVVTNIFFCVTLLSTGLPIWIIILTGGVCALYVLSSSKFGVQALLFLTPLVSLFALSVLPVSSLILGILLLSTISKGAFLNSLKQQLGHLRWYFSKNFKGEMSVSGRNKFDSTYLRRRDECFTRYLFRLLFLLASRNSYTGVVIKMPVLLVVLIGYCFISGNDNLSTLMAPVFASTIIYFLINLPPLLFLGEAERYLNHVAVFFVIAAISIVDALQLESMLWLLIVYGILYLVFEATIMPRLNRNGLKMHKDHSKIVSYLKSQPSTVVLCYPYHAGGGVYRIMAETDHNTVFPLCSTEEFAQKLESQYGGKYPFIDLSKLDDMHNSLGVDILIVSKSSVEKNMQSEWRPSENWNEVKLSCELEKVYAYKF